MKAAKFIKTVPLFKGNDARLYALSEPIEGVDGQRFSHVVVGGVGGMYSLARTFIIGANEKGEILDHSPLKGTFNGGFDHHKALTKAGYQVID